MSLEVDPLPAETQDDCIPGQHLDYSLMSWDLKPEDPAKPYPDSWPTETLT